MNRKLIAGDCSILINTAIFVIILHVTFSTDELAEEFKRKAAIFNRNLRGLEDKAKKCESLKWVVSKHEGIIIEAFLERLSIQCRKTTTKVHVITLTNHKERKQHNGPIRTRSKCMQPVPSAGKSVVENFGNQSQSVIKQNQSKRELTFDLLQVVSLNVTFSCLCFVFNSLNETY